ncbi:ABC transporter permease subunit, partial [Pseudomonas aeruginosa]|nr:ABC transporter permease subunit [Pseudomonas aeruginosa]
MPSSPSSLPSALVLLFAVACGLSVANVYYAQPLLDVLGAEFAIGQAGVGLLFGATQAGCALALLLVVPLGDLLERRRLMFVQLLLLLLSLLLVFTPFPGSRLIARVIDTFIAMPTFLITLAFTFIYGSAGLLNGTLMAGFGFTLPPVDFLYSIWGVILAEITVFTPLVMRPLMAALSQIDRSQLEAASILGARPGRVVRQVILPAALPALLAGGSLCLP